MLYSLQDAKAKFSELVGLCLREGPQTVTRHGQNVVVVVPYDEYRRWTAPTGGLGSFFRAAPRAVLDLSRSTDPDREVDFQ